MMLPEGSGGCREELEGRMRAWPTQADRRRPGSGSPIRGSKTGAERRL